MENEKEPIHVLLVEDSPLQAEVIEQELLKDKRNSFQIRHVDCLGLALDGLKESKTDVILTDLHLPDSAGLETALTLMEHAPAIPLVVLTGSMGDQAVGIDAIRHGAQDYLCKDMDLKIIGQVLCYAIERKRLEQQIKQYARELETANEDLEAFSYSVSHDLRAPLRAIEVLSKNLSGGLESIHQNAEYTLRLINDLLAFSRVGQLAIQRADIDMGELARLTSESVLLDKPNRKIRFKINSLPHAAGDPTLIHQVVQNLLANSFKYTGTKEQAVIEVGAIDKEKETTYFVRDNGIGFEAANAESLFVIFKRLPNAEGFEGTGCGLAIVERIIRKHGGRVWAEGKLGEGAVFYFTLPKETKTLCPQSAAEDGKNAYGK